MSQYHRSKRHCLAKRSDKSKQNIEYSTMSNLILTSDKICFFFQTKISFIKLKLFIVLDESVNKQLVPSLIFVYEMPIEIRNQQHTPQSSCKLALPRITWLRTVCSLKIQFINTLNSNGMWHFNCGSAFGFSL